MSRSGADNWLGQPLHRRVPMRRSTLVILVAFIALGALYLWTRPQESSRTEQAENSAMVYTVTRPTELVALAALSTAKQVPEQQHESGHGNEHRDGEAPVREE